MRPMIDALVFIVDDDASVREALAWLLRSRRLPSEVFDSAEAFQHKMAGGASLAQPSCLLLDVRMPGLSGLALFDWLIGRELHQALPVIFLTGHADVPTAVEAVKRGAFDFCEKPCSDNALVDRVEQALANRRHFCWRTAKTGFCRSARTSGPSVSAWSWRWWWKDCPTKSLPIGSTSACERS